MVRQADALGAADARRERSGHASIRSSGSTTSAGCTPTPPRSAPAASSRTTRPRCRCTIAAPGSATSDPFGTLVAGCRAMGMHVVARTDPHAVRDEVRAAHPDWIARDARRRAATALGEPRAVGHVRARALQLRVHGPGPPRDRHEVQGRRHLLEPLGAAGRRLLLRPLPEELQGRDRHRPAAHDRSRAIRRGARTSSGARRG